MTGHVITLAQQKGGAGKTTLAAHLAVAWTRAGYSVSLVDIDPQGSLANWHAVRRQFRGQDCGFDLAAIGGWRVDGEVRRLRSEAQIVLVDTAPHAETEARLAMRASNLVIIPVQPTPMDLWATRPTLTIAEEEKSSVLMVLNRVPPRGKLAERVLEELQALERPIAETRIGNRQAFAATMMDGLGVGEKTRRGLAVKEIDALAAEILQKIETGKQG